MKGTPVFRIAFMSESYRSSTERPGSGFHVPGWWLTVQTGPCIFSRQQCEINGKIQTFFFKSRTISEMRFVRDPCEIFKKNRGFLGAHSRFGFLARFMTG